MTINVLLADDHQMVREGIKRFLDGEPDIEVIGQSADGRSAVEMACELKPDVVVLDIGLPKLHGAAAARRMIDNAPELKVIALSMHSDTRSLVGMLQAGARGYITKARAYKELALAIREVYGGNHFLSPEMTSELVELFMASPESVSHSPAPALTIREREVLQLLAEGHGSKEIAFELGLSARTVDTHRRNIMEKLGINSIAGLVKYAVRQGISSLDGPASLRDS